MSPPIHKDWWLAAALTGAALPAAMGQTVANVDRRQTGVVTTVTKGAPATSAPIYIDSARDQKLTTGPNQTLHVLFSDQSALTVGPNSEIVITDYKFDKQTKDGNLLVEMTKGLLRVVGGFISKKTEAVVRTNTATIGIRGGISMIEHNDGQTTGGFLFGQSMRMTSSTGNTQTVNRPGFGMTASGGGLSEPQRIPTSQFNSQLQRMEGGPSSQNPFNSNLEVGFGGNANASSSGNMAVEGFANDRLKNAADSNFNLGPTNTLRAMLGTSSGQVQS